MSHLTQQPAKNLDAVLHSQVMGDVWEPLHKGPWDLAPFPRGLVKDASVIRESLCTISTCLGNETCFLW